eukprot:SM000158S02034  [mRNA]  locus=s158:197084:199210:+ [translate_table: standard]
MDYTGSYRHTGAAAFSPDGRLLAAADGARLTIRDADTLAAFTCAGRVAALHWSPDSAMVLCALPDEAAAQVWAPARPEWRCRVDEGAAGLTAAWWAPSGRHVAVASDYGLHLSLWSLLDAAVTRVALAKPGPHMASFSPDGAFAAVAVREDCQDRVAVLACETWQTVGAFPTDTADLAGLAWSPAGGSIAVWDSCLQYQVLIYSPAGICLAKHVACEHGLGVRTVAWSPSGRFLAVGAHDPAARVLDGHHGWKLMAECNHAAVVTGPLSAIIYKEAGIESKVDFASLSLAGRDELKQAAAMPAASAAKYELAELPFSLGWRKVAPGKPNPKQGIGLAAWSTDGRFLVTRADEAPHALHIWEAPGMDLAAVLVHESPVRMAAWDPSGGARLALCTGGPRLYTWSPHSAACAAVPHPDFAVLDLAWSPAGNVLLLKDSTSFCCAFFSPDSEKAEPA